MKEKPSDSILVACSSQPQRELIAAMLAVDGYQLHLARDSHEAMESLSQETPDLIILDSRLLGQNGYSLCAHIRQHGAGSAIPVIIMARGAEADSRKRALEAGADDCLSGPVSMVELRAKASALVNARHRYGELVDVDRALLTLAAAVDAKDPWERGHLERVVDYSLRLGRALGMDARQLRNLRCGAILHDMGKLGVPEAILNKAGPLSPSDWQHIRLHPIIGERICQPLGQEREVMEVVRYHHERFDGRGYPDGLAGRQIPLVGRVVALADAYDALTTDRPYREKLSPQQAQAVLRVEAGQQFDPELVALFLPLLEEGK